MNHLITKKRQLGQGMTEYIIIVALVAVAAIGVYSAFGEAIRGQMANLTGEISGKGGATGKATAEGAAAAAESAASDKKSLSNFGDKGGK